MAEERALSDAANDVTLVLRDLSSKVIHASKRYSRC